jgi:hypothetical protein
MEGASFMSCSWMDTVAEEKKAVLFTSVMRVTCAKVCEGSRVS